VTEMIIGITGGIGSGKSYVLSVMEKRFACLLLEADAIAFQLEQPLGSCYQPILQLFGREILASDNTIDRQKLGKIVFADKKKLKRLNQIVHPAVKKKIREEIRLSQAKEPDRIILIEAALLLEDHYDAICDTIWYIRSSEETRRKRLKEKRGYSEEKITAVMKNQLPEAEFIRQCNCVINNDGTEEELIMQIEACLKRSRQEVIQRGQEFYE